ncbi:STAS-like domain-containing protein [Vibrio fluvialis]|uniref:STAS-like domain-containing protein n=1 Tax=Vibrio fluvialis TaxID=676 RepID=UPI001F15CC57|nr:DUF4325 domain-containing protein [Vibrio fluvialis]MCE7607959.1 STAS-like domain-containing protein [Vibrio fluvialis]
MKNIIHLYVTDYTYDPFGRYEEDGEGNGEVFRTKYLMPVLNRGDIAYVHLDGINDEYGSSFIVEAFANLIRKENMSYDDVKNRVKLVSRHQDWIDEIDDYIREARNDVACGRLSAL